MVVRESKEMRVLNGVVYMTKSRGPRTEPWGTRQEEIFSKKKYLSHLTRKNWMVWLVTPEVTWTVTGRLLWTYLEENY